MRRLRLALAVLVLSAAGGGGAIAWAATSHHPAKHAAVKPKAKRHSKRCYARRHGHRVVVRCPKPKPKPKPKVRPKTTTTTTTTRRTTTSLSTTTVATTTTVASTSTASDYCTTYGLPRSTEVDESDQGDGSYLLAPACPHLASGSDQFNVYNDDSQTHNFAVRDASGQFETLSFAGGRTGTTLTVSPGGESTAQSATVDLPPGTYTLMCTLHPGMQATITVG